MMVMMAIMVFHWIVVSVFVDVKKVGLEEIANQQSIWTFKIVSENPADHVGCFFHVFKPSK